MPQFRKKPVVIEAVQFVGSNADEIAAWAKEYGQKITYMEGFSVDVLAIDTLEGRMMARMGDWIIKGVKNEFYPCKSEIFAATYEPV